LNILPEIYLNW